MPSIDRSSTAMTCGENRSTRARRRSPRCWPRPRPACVSTSQTDGPPVFAHACKMGLEGIVSKRRASRYRSGRSTCLAQDEEPGLRGSEARRRRTGGGSRGRITLSEHQRRRAEPRNGPVHLRWDQPTIAVNFIATRVPNRATRPYLPRSSSALVMRRQSPANLSRQMATGFGFDGCRVGTVVGIRSVRV